jgi:ABC-type nitrate/sulfonate/bicarbonate transport system substrate-binding protein
MPQQMAQGYLDGFCSGEPWNSIAAHEGWGSIVAFTTDILPGHPEKVLAVSKKWYEQNPTAAQLLVRATLRGCAFCQDTRHVDQLAEMLASHKYFRLPAPLLRESLLLSSSAGRVPHLPTHPIRSFAAATTFPSATHSAWLIDQMIRWGHLSPDLDVLAIARGCTETTPYREAAASLHIDCPAEDLPPLPLRHGLWYEPVPSA